MKLIWSLILCVFGFIAPVLGKQYTGPADSVKASKSFDTLAKQLARQYRLDLLNTGLGDLIGTKKSSWAISYMSRQPTTLEQAREMAIPLWDTIWQKVSTEPAFLSHLQYLKLSLSQESTGFKIAYWDEQYDRWLKPYLAQVTVTNGQVLYFYADPETQALLPPLVETLEEARAALRKNIKPSVL